MSRAPHPFPSVEDMALARDGSRALSRLVKRGRGRGSFVVAAEDQSTPHVRIPAAALPLIVDMLAELGQGHGVGITPIHAELTTQAAADLLNVSRPFLIKLLERGELPFHRVGTHRRVRYADVIAYRARVEVKRQRALKALTAEAQRLGLGYD